MTHDITYKGLKYIAVWILLYFIVRLSFYGLSQIDNAIIAGVLTLLICVLEIMCEKNPHNTENLEFLNNNDSGSSTSPQLDLSALLLEGSSKFNDAGNEIKANTGPDTNNIAANILAKVADTLENAASDAAPDSVSSDSASASDSVSSDSSGPGGSFDLTRKEYVQQGKKDFPVLMNPNPHPKPSINTVNNSLEHTDPHNSFNTKEKQNTIASHTESYPQNNIDNKKKYLIHRDGNIPSADSSSGNYYVREDDVGNQAIFDQNAFGGTGIQPNKILKSLHENTMDRETQKIVNKGDGNNAVMSRNDLIPNISIQLPDKDGFVKQDTATVQTPFGLTHDNKMFEAVDNKNKDYKAIRDANINAAANQYAKPSIHQNISKSTENNGNIDPSYKWDEVKFDPRRYAGAENLDQIEVSDGKTRNDLLVNMMSYSDFNRMPPSFNKDDFEYGYSMLPPKDWYPVPPYPPVCASNSTCQVQPVYLDNLTMNLKEWHETQKLTPPDSINTAFIRDELNSKV